MTEIVEYCARLPLAVRIAGARFVAGGWSSARFRDRLADETTRLGALEDGERAVAAAFAVSYRALPDDQRRLFGLVALHPGPLTELATINVMAGLPPGEADRLLDRLHDAHLLTLDSDGYVELHDLMRTFAVRYALADVDADDQAEAAARLVDHVTSVVVAADTLIEPHRFRPRVDCPAPHRPPFADADGALTWLRTQWPTVVQIVDLAADRGLRRPCWQLAFILRAFFFREKLLEPWLRTHRRALDSARAENDLVATGMILNNLGMAHIETGAVAEAIDCHRRALDCLIEAGDERGATDALSSLAWARMYQGEPEVTVQDLTTALTVYRRTGRDRNVVIAHRGIALALAALERFDDALEHAHEARRLAKLPVDVLQGISCIAWIHFQAGHLDDADRGYAEAADLADLADNGYERARAITGLGNVAALRGDRHTAERHWADAARLPATLYPQVLGEAQARMTLANKPSSC